MRLIARLLAPVLFVLPMVPSRAQRPTRVIVVSGVTDGGCATDLWLAILWRRLAPAEFDSDAGIVHPLSAAELAWSDTLSAHAKHWSDEVPALVRAFAPLPAPDSVRVVVGNRGSEDAFTHDSLTIGFDLSALVRVYGPADSGDNPAKLDRFFRHEFSHTIQKRWLARYPFMVRTPLDAALLDIWLEGLGNYYSLGPRWLASSVGPSPLAAETLARLSPLFVERLSGLACADSATAAPLLKGLSSGPFAKKWGAVTMALWLSHDRSDNAKFVQAGPNGVWQLADRHLAGELRTRLQAAHRAAGQCAR